MDTYDANDYANDILELDLWFGHHLVELTREFKQRQAAITDRYERLAMRRHPTHSSDPDVEAGQGVPEVPDDNQFYDHQFDDIVNQFTDDIDTYNDVGASVVNDPTLVQHDIPLSSPNDQYTGPTTLEQHFDQLPARHADPSLDWHHHHADYDVLFHAWHDGSDDHDHHAHDFDDEGDIVEYGPVCHRHDCRWLRAGHNAWGRVEPSDHPSAHRHYFGKPCDLDPCPIDAQQSFDV